MLDTFLKILFLSKNDQILRLTNIFEENMLKKLRNKRNIRLFECKIGQIYLSISKSLNLYKIFI